MDTKTANTNELLSFLFDLTPIEAEAAKQQLFPNPGEMFCCDKSSDFDLKLAAAIEIDRRRASMEKSTISSPDAMRALLKRLIGNLKHEVFVCMFLDSQHAIIVTEEMFQGTATQTSVYPREVVKRALEINACAVILAHNHPSGVTQPSRADEHLTQTLKATLALIDVRVLDHFIVTKTEAISMAKMGLV